MSTLLTAQIEVWSDVMPELAQVFPQHWRELGYHHEAMPLDLRWPVYEWLEQQGSLLVATLREGNVLAGYAVLLVGPDMHHATQLTADTDTFYVLPKYRGRLGGRRLFRFVEGALRQRGVTLWQVGASLRGDGSRLLTMLGFSPTQTTYSKVLISS